MDQGCMYKRLLSGPRASLLFRISLKKQRAAQNRNCAASYHQRNWSLRGLEPVLEREDFFLDLGLDQGQCLYILVETFSGILEHQIGRLRFHFDSRRVLVMVVVRLD